MLLTEERPYLNELTYLQFSATILESIPVQVCQKRPRKSLTCIREDGNIKKMSQQEPRQSLDLLLSRQRQK